MSLAIDVQQLEMDAKVTLFDIDARSLGATSIYHFSPCHNGGNPIVWGGVSYTPVDCEATGFEQKADGGLPHPQFRITNVNKLMMSAVISFDDLLGAIITRKRTLKKYLDNGSSPDPDAGYPEDVYVVTRQLARNKVEIVWELSAYLDSEEFKLPRRLMTRDVCEWIYRYWDGGQFVYDTSGRACPYVGTSYFDADGNVTTAENDDCGLERSDCRLRFPGTQDLPFGAFPGLGRSRGY